MCCRQNLLSGVSTLVAAVLVGFPGSLQAQPGSFWTESYGGSDLDCFYGIASSEGGGFVLAGSTRSSGAGSDDGWLVLVDSLGTVLFDRTYGGEAADYFYSVAPVPGGGFAAAGFTESSGAGNRDFWLVRTDSEGVPMWERTLGSSGCDEARSLQVTSDGGFLLAGFLTPYNGGSVDAWLVKYDSQGECVLSKLYPGEGSRYGMSASETDGGGFIIAGFEEETPGGFTDGWMAGTDPWGQILWENTYGGEKDDVIRWVIETWDGGFAAAGHTLSYSPVAAFAWVVKTGPQGEYCWDRIYGGTQWDQARQVEQVYGGGYALAGSTNSLGAGSSDAWLVQTDPWGNVLWEMTFGGENWDQGFSVIQTSRGGYALAGSTRSFGSGSSDGFLAMTAPAQSTGPEQTTAGAGLICAPNPSSGTVSISCHTPDCGETVVTVHDLSGRLLATLQAGYMPEGSFVRRWNPGDVPSGIYLIRLQTPVRCVCGRVLIQR